MRQLTRLWLKFTLESDAAFGRGDGVAGAIDAEIQHDEYGLPYLGGKTLKGLLSAECAEILWSLQKCAAGDIDAWRDAARYLFGESGGALAGAAAMHVGDAMMPPGVRQAIISDYKALSLEADEKRRNLEWGLKRRAVLDSLTALRRQTAIDPRTGAPKKNALRTIRVVLRKTPFVAALDFDGPPPDRARWLLAACARAFRRAGSGRRRGHGLLHAEIYDVDCYTSRAGDDGPVEPATAACFALFAEEVRRESSHV